MPCKTCFVAACIFQVPNYCCIFKIIYAYLLLGPQNYSVKICVLMPIPQIGTQNCTKNLPLKNPLLFIVFFLEIQEKTRSIVRT